MLSRRGKRRLLMLAFAGGILILLCWLSGKLDSQLTLMLSLALLISASIIKILPIKPRPYRSRH
ncbi:MAG: hypothetical protein Q4C74_00645 [Rothia sp. (in: high G+C Gram-positive bacteria)]|nr:hypothetical protein [Rothia sp. (in: high G+C Gram-positive bacteria)]